MICDDGDRVFHASQVLVPLCKCPYDIEEFAMIGSFSFSAARAVEIIHSSANILGISRRIV